MVQLTTRDPDWYEVEGFPEIRLRLKPYGLMAGIAAIGDYDPDAEYTAAERSRVLANGLIDELGELLVEWEGVDTEAGELAEISKDTIAALICTVPGVYAPIRAVIDQHRERWGEEGNVSRKPLRGRRKEVSTTAKPVVRRRRRARKESPAPTGNGALSSSTGRGP